MDFSPKTPADQEFFAFDYARRLGTGETIASAVWTASVVEGTDGNPSALISGTATVSGSRVSQKIIGGTADVQYCLVCTATTSRPQILVESAHVWVRGACD